MKRTEIKVKAQKLIEGKLWVIWKPFLLIILISAVISFLLDRFLPLTYSYQLFSSSGTTLKLDLSNAIGAFIMTPISVGYIFYILNFIRGKELSIDDIFSKIKYILPIWGVTILVNIFAGIGFAFLIIPGIIISLIFTMVEYLMADDETNVIEVLKKSKDMMKGYKWDYFVFNLSFIGWIILSIITIGILSIYTIPYMTVSQALYYEELKKLKEPK